MLQVGVKVFLEKEEGKFLLLKRSIEKYPDTKGIWDIVGGRIDEGTSLEENLRREVREETALEIISTPKLIFAQDIILGEQDRHVVRLTFVARTEGEVVLDTEEHTEYKWLALKEMEEIEGLDVYVQEVLESGVLK